MLYFRCPTCGTLLANKQLVYEQKLEEICLNRKLNNKEKNDLKRKLLDDMELHRSCCRMRIMGYVKLIEKIK